MYNVDTCDGSIVTTEKEVLLILGNGFDLDLGLKTSYKDFFNNELPYDEGRFPFARGGEDYGLLGKYIIEANYIEKWLDLVHILAEFVKHNQRISEKDASNVMRDYEKLKVCLFRYLDSLDYSSLNNNSLAAKLLTVLSGYLFFTPIIYSFNYTSLSGIYKSLGIENWGEANHVHGSLAERNIILGIGDSSEAPLNLSFLYKTNDYNYRSSNLYDELDKNNTIIFFGHSLSVVDYPYFKDFYNSVSKGEYRGQKKKYIRIFTFDNKS